MSSEPRSGDMDTEILLELTDGGENGGEGTVSRETTVAGTELADADVERLLNRLPDLEAESDDQVEFRRPVETRPPPRPGTTVEQAFPPAAGDTSSPTPDPGPLEVLRFQPEGPVDTAPFLSVTFNQPMVPLTSLDQLESIPVPIEVTPELPGRWIWLGARTARFEYELGEIDRLPGATNYRVAIEAGTTSASGAELADTVQFAFSTPAAEATAVTPMTNSLATDQMFLVQFNQRIDPTAAVGVSTLTVDGDDVPIRLATADEIADDPALQQRVDRLLDARWLVLRSVDPLPTDAAITINIGPALESAEGPETSTAASRWDGRTYGDFTIVDSRCGWDGCRPGDQFMIQLSNPIDGSEFDSSMISVDPEISSMNLSVFGDQIVVQGRTSGQTTYTVTLDESLTDVFGQQLGEREQVEFNVGDAQPALFNPGRRLVTLDPIIADDVLTITSINNDELRVRVWEVDPAMDWTTYANRGWGLAYDDWEPQWPLVDERLVDGGGTNNEFTEVPINLADQLDSSGHAVVLIEPTERSEQDWRNEPIVVWVQRTTIGIDVWTDQAGALARVTDLRTGEPLSGAVIQTLPATKQATTDDDGLATLDTGGRAEGLVASHRDQVALLGEYWAEPSRTPDQTRWYITDDRGLYQPGETVNLKGWVRTASFTTPSQLSTPADATVTWYSFDAFGNEIASGTERLSAQGGFDLTIEIPENATPGQAGIEFSASGAGGDAYSYHQFQIQEFRRPDYEVVTEVLTAGPHLAAEGVSVEGSADYFAGGPLALSDIEWQVSASLASYRPPDHPGFEFGIWVPWWLSHGFGEFGEFGEFDDFGGGFGGFGDTSEFLSAQTDGAGQHRITANVDTQGKVRPVRVRAAATVFDVNRQAISSSTSWLVHPAELYVGMRGSRVFVQAGDDLPLDLIVTDIDGATVSDVAVTVDLVLLRSEYAFGNFDEIEEPVDSCVVTSAAEPVTCTFTPEEGGRYRVTATIEDAQGRTNLTEVTRWVAGGDRPASRQVTREDVTLIPGQQTAEPGDVVEVLVQSPFADAHGIAILTRGTISSTQTIDFDDDGVAQLEIAVSEDDIPALGVQVEIVGTAPRGDGGSQRPAFASGSLTLRVPPTDRQLIVSAAPQTDVLTPGGETTLDVEVATVDGEPVAGAELLVVVVDEAVLSLTNYQLRDPLDAFYQRSGGWLQAWRGRSTLVLSDDNEATLTQGEGGTDTEAASAGDASADFDDEAMEEEAFAADDAAGAPAPEAASLQRSAGLNQDRDGAATPVELREDFSALAVFEPEVTTDDSGRATVDVPLPDNLTRYRVMVVAVADEFAGSDESNLTAQLPISVRPTPPRFANFGDAFEFPVVVQNATNEDRSIDVALRSTNLNLDDRDGATVNVPANDRVEVRFLVGADQAGTARWQVVAASGDLSDAAEGSFPVYTPATSEAFATYGTLDAGSTGQQVIAPTEVIPQFGGLEITTTSTAVAALTDAVVYMDRYRYESSDAAASRALALLALDDVFAAFGADGVPSPDELETTLAADLARLSDLQNNDGGFPWWQRGRPSIPFVSVQATHALVMADNEGRAVDNDTLQAGLGYTTSIEDHIPSWYSAEARRAIRAYAVHVLNLADTPDVAAAERLWAETSTADDGPQLDVVGWIWPTLADDAAVAEEIFRLLTNRVTETANAATFTTDYREDEWLILHSDRRTDAIILDALLSERPDSDLVTKTLNGILAARNRYGHWTNVQENAFILLAGSRYFAAFEDADPSFVARAWLGDTYAVEQEFEGRSTDRNLSIIPMSELVDGGDQELVIAKEGDGRLYYRLGLTYAPADLTLDPRDQGFVVARTYESVDDDDDVTQNDDGTWEVQAGARVRVRVTMIADSRRTHVALIDPLPAGFETVNPVFATSQPTPPGETPSGSWWYSWFNHQNLRDDRAEAFATWLGAGAYEYTYIARATTPGRFVVPPAKAEQIYEPEVFGRGASTVVTIVD